MSKRQLEKLIETQCNELERRIAGGAIQNAKEADEAAAELTGDSGLNPSTGEFDVLLSVLCTCAGKAFPGDWEDYPRRNLI